MKTYKAYTKHLSTKDHYEWVLSTFFKKEYKRKYIYDNLFYMNENIGAALKINDIDCKHKINAKYIKDLAESGFFDYHINTRLAFHKNYVLNLLTEEKRYIDGLFFEKKYIFDTVFLQYFKLNGKIMNHFSYLMLCEDKIVYELNNKSCNLFFIQEFNNADEY